MNIGEYDATTEAARAGVATWIRSAPTPRAPYPTSAGAPVYGPPAITRTRPFCPLWLVALRNGESGHSAGPINEAILAGVPRSPTPLRPAVSARSPPYPSWSVTDAV